MKLLVLGGTRFLGKHIVEAAMKKGHSVTLFNRGSQQNLFPEAEHLIGDRENDVRALQNRSWDAVVDTCGFVPKHIEDVMQQLSSRIKHYTFISSLSVLPNPIKAGIDEKAEVETISSEILQEIYADETKQKRLIHYGALKALCEKTADEYMPGKVLHIRAGQLVGPNDYTDRLPYWVNRIAKGGTVLAPGDPDRPVQLIDTRDLGKWIVEMAEKQVAGVFNATGPQITMEELLNECKKVTGSNAEIMWVSEKFLFDEKISPWVQMPLWIPEHFGIDGSDSEPWKGFFRLNIEKAIENGLTFRPLDYTLKDVYEWDLARLDRERKAGISLHQEQKLLEKWKVYY